MEEIIVGVVFLQFEVLEHRLKNEYNVEIHKSPLPYQYIRWVKEGTDLKSLNLSSDTRKVQDLKGQPLYCSLNDWGVRWAQDKNKGLELLNFLRTKKNFLVLLLSNLNEKELMTYWVEHMKCKIENHLL